MRRRRVKITGIGFVTPAGIGKQAFLRGIQEPVSRVVLVKRFPEEAGPFLAAEIRGFRLEHFLPDFPSKRVPRHTQFALAAAMLAAADAGLTLGELRGKSPLIIIGAALMDFESINKGVELILRRGVVQGLPSSVRSANVSSIAGAIAEAIGGATRTLALQSACCAGSDAIGHAASMVASGEAEVALCGGTEAPLFFHPMLELKMAGLAPGNPEFPERQCRPFDKWRTTGVIGEGSCVVMLEPEESPRKGYAFIDGYAYSTDPAGGLVDGLVDAIKLSLANARIRANQIECISAWGPGHRAIDVAEARALRAVFGSDLNSVAAASIKGAIGNPLGAAGAIQIGCAALGISAGFIPPTVNWQFPDPDCQLNLSGVTRFIEHKATLVNSHGLSGTNACLVLRR